MSRAPRIALVVVAALVLAVAGALVLWSGAGEGGSSPGTGQARGADELSAALRRAVSLPGIMDHLRALQDIADDNGGNRSAGTSGYDESASYVASPVDFDASAQSSSSGCETSDFDGFHEGAIALVRRGNCFFRDQALNAERAGASAVLIAQEQGSDDVLRGTLTPDSGVAIPALGITNQLSGELSSGESLLSVSVDASIEERPTHNLLAETSTGNADEVIMVGAHLDSVPAGPGMNDNGSGVATILEVAQEIADMEPPTRIRFAFWGAEEFGLIGSAHYVTNLSTSEQDQIAGYLNFDMLGSPNYVRFVYDGRRAGAGSVEASTAIQDLFENYFADENLETDVIGLEGRSDHAFFDRVGIPVGGLFSGADDVKTQAEASTYGGKVGEIHDACYHQSCDTLDNVNREVLDELADGVAHAVATLAAAPDIVNGVGERSFARGLRDRGFPRQGGY